MDLRKSYEKKKDLNDGIAYLKNNVLQIYRTIYGQDVVRYVRETLLYTSASSAEKQFMEDKNV